MKTLLEEVSICFDEGHSESWTIDSNLAFKINPTYPENASYSNLADSLRGEGFIVTRNTKKVTKKIFKYDIYIIVHPTLELWEKTTNIGKPIFTNTEISIIHKFIQKGRSLIVISEYEYEKYGSNLNNILDKFGLSFNNTTYKNKNNCMDNPMWINISNNEIQDKDIIHLIKSVCFYRMGTCKITKKAMSSISFNSMNSEETLLAHYQHKKSGHIFAIPDSDAFGNEFIYKKDNLQLFKNIIYKCLSNKKINSANPIRDITDIKIVFKLLKDELEKINKHLASDGSLLKNKTINITIVINCLKELKKLIPYQKKYFNILIKNFKEWYLNPIKPNFENSFSAYKPNKY